MSKVGGSLVWGKKEMMLVKLVQDPDLMTAVLTEDSSSQYCIYFPLQSVRKKNLRENQELLVADNCCVGKLWLRIRIWQIHAPVLPGCQEKKVQPFEKLKPY